MSSDTDHPRQRTVAELLAEHGDTGAMPRRRRRREPDAPAEDGIQPDDTGSGFPAAPVADRRAPLLPEHPAAPSRPLLPDRSVLREPVPPQRPAGPEPDAPRTAGWDAGAGRIPADPLRERPTDVMPRIHEDDDAGSEFTSPIPHQSAGPRRAGAAVADEDDVAGPSTMIGAAPAGAEEWHKARTEDARAQRAAIDGGPPLAADDEDAASDPALDELDDADEAPAPRARRLGRSAAEPSAGQAWAAVAAQWIAGAVGGAVLWVAFRFLWRELPVVALAAAVLVTIGLVVVVRALLRNNDNRTTMFAVLVGLLLTVSPAILVLLGR